MNSNSFTVKGFGEQYADKTPDGIPQPMVIQQITVRPVNRTSQDIKKWRFANRAAESYIPRRVVLYDLYEDVMLDGHVIAVTGKLYDAVTLTNWAFIGADGNQVDAVMNIIDSLGFSDLLTEIAKEDTWGYSMIECDFFKDFRGQIAMSAYQCDRKHMRPLTGIITYEQTGDDGINIRQGIYPNFILECGNPKSLGRLLSVSQYAILKDGDFSDWSAFVQTYGQPIVSAEWDGFDEGQRIKFLKSLEGLGPGGSITRPSGSKIELLESKANADGAMQQNLLEALNAEISKAMLGATESTQSSSSSGYAQSETHEDVEDKRKQSLINKVRRVLNSRFTRILEANGIDTKGGKFIIQSTEDQLPKDKAFIVHKSMLSDLDIPIDDDFFYETYNVPKPADYVKQKADLLAVKAQNQAQGMPIAVDPNAPTPHPSGGKKGKQPPSNGKQPPGDEPDDEQQPPPKKTLKKLRDLLSFFSEAPAMKTTGAKMTACCGIHQPIYDRFIKLADKSPDDAIIRAVWASKGNVEFDPTVFAFTAQTLLNGLDGGWNNKPMVQLADIGFDYGVNDPGLLTAFELNLFRFAGVKTLAEAQQLNQLFKESTSFNEFYEKATGVTNIFNKGYLQTEYNTAYLTGEASATYYRLIKQTKLFPYWEYRTVGDDKVRPAHAALNGLILPADDPRWDSIYPPNGWNCRCWIVPRTKAEAQDVNVKDMQARADAYFKTSDFKADAAQGWGVNRAKTGEVFSTNQQYINTFKGNASATLNGLNAASYDLPQYSTAKGNATALMPEYKGTPQGFFKDGTVLKDYNGRTLLDADQDLTSANTPLLTALQQTLAKPDEVWVNGAKLDQLVYIKYYNDKTMVAVASIGSDNTLQLGDWFTLTETKAEINKYRSGLLVFNK
jgi:SPP1 gp7 family putative phage head morphogenesis protein